MTRRPIGRVGCVLLGVVFFFLPLLATLRFSLFFNRLGWSTQAYGDLLRDRALRGPLWLSMQLAFLTLALAFTLMVPTMVWLHLKVPGARAVLEFISILPFVIPPIVLVVGVARTTQGWPESIVGRPFFLVPIYVVVCLPFLFRSFDAGIRSIDLITLTEASRNLGASWRTTLGRVVIPALRTSLLGGAFLTIAVVLGEFTISSLLLFKTFPVYLTGKGQTEVQGAAAASLLSFGFVWVLLLVLLALTGGRRR